MNNSKTMLLLLVILFAFLMRVDVRPAAAIGIANVVVTNVYWGGNPASPDTAHPGDVNLQLSILISNVGDDVARNHHDCAVRGAGPPGIFLELALSEALESER